MVPGKIFERKYNAEGIEINHAGAVIPSTDFTPDIIRNTAERLIGSKMISNNARELGAKLLSAGGVETILREIRNFEK